MNFSELRLLVAGVGILLAIYIGVILPSTLPTLRARLHREHRQLRARQYQMAKVERVAEKAIRHYKKLEARRDKVPPRKLHAAKILSEDKQKLLRQACDKVIEAENLVRRTILEEFPPCKHEKLLDKMVPRREDDDPTRTPFSFR